MESLVYAIWDQEGAVTSSRCVDPPELEGQGAENAQTVHNGIEQGMLGVYCEAYALLRHSIGLTNTEIADVFDEWNKYGELRDNYVGARPLCLAYG